LYHPVHRETRKILRDTQAKQKEMLDNCLAAFIRAGTLELSLDHLAREAGTSKRMLIHYFRGRETLEEMAMALLEERLRQQFRADAFPPGTTLRAVALALWDRTTHPDARGVLLLVMDLSRRAWSDGSGSARAKAFIAEQQRLWIDLLMAFSDDRRFVESLLQLFQGCVMAFLVNGDHERGRQAIETYCRLISIYQRIVR
jgi:AcrR family transcriptional regulator